MKQFITGPSPDNKIVNLSKVSNIAFEYYVDRNGIDTWKIIYNFSFSISLKNNIQKKVPDYHYMVYKDKLEYDKKVEELNDLVNVYGWLAPRVKGSIDRIVNPDYISFIATDTKKKRIILNLTTSVSFWNDLERLSSDFIYVDFPTIEEFHLEYEYLKDQLDNREL